MMLIPYRTAVYATRLSEREIIDRLCQKVEMPSNEKVGYDGTVRENAFTIKRRISYRNSFLPIIDGEIVPKNMRTLVRVTMHLHKAIVLFLLLFCLFPILLLGMGLLLEDSPKTGPSVFPFLMPLFAYLLSLIGFIPESAKAHTELLALFEAEEEK